MEIVAFEEAHESSFVTGLSVLGVEGKGKSSRVRIDGPFLDVWTRSLEALFSWRFSGESFTDALLSVEEAMVRHTVSRGIGMDTEESLRIAVELMSLVMSDPEDIRSGIESSKESGSYDEFLRSVVARAVTSSFTHDGRVASRIVLSRVDSSAFWTDGSSEGDDMR